MNILLSEIMNTAGTEKVLPYSFVGMDFKYLGDSYPYDVSSRATVTLSIPKKKQVHVLLKGDAMLWIPCARCLTEVLSKITLSAEFDFDFSEEAEEDEEQNLASFLNGYDLDVDRLVYEEILLGFPMKVLCKEDCKGICKVCGANLNQGECGCDRTEPDPRMSVIRDIFNNFKEV